MSPTMRLVGTQLVCGTLQGNDGKSPVGSLGWSRLDFSCFAFFRADYFFSISLRRKSVLIDPRFGPAWLAYAHSFAFEGEHDQAITAYSTAHRHLSGSHLPLLFIGMQHLGLSNVVLAEEYLLAAREVCKDDPLVLNELGVIHVHNEE